MKQEKKIYVQPECDTVDIYIECAILASSVDKVETETNNSVGTLEGIEW